MSETTGQSPRDARSITGASCVTDNSMQTLSCCVKTLSASNDSKCRQLNQLEGLLMLICRKHCFLWFFWEDIFERLGIEEADWELKNRLTKQIIQACLGFCWGPSLALDLNNLDDTFDGVRQRSNVHTSYVPNLA